MDNGCCTILYLDRRAQVTGSVTSESLPTTHAEEGDQDVAHNISTVVSAFGQAFVCSDGVSCLTKIAQLDEVQNPCPILVLLDMPGDDEPSGRKASWDARTPSPTTSKRPKVERHEPSDLYGIHLLQYVASEIQQRVRSRLVIPIAVLQAKLDFVNEPLRMSRYLDAGAIDVLSAPLTSDRVQALSVHAYRRSKEVVREQASFVLEKRNRKLSWVGLDEERPYAYLREVMVSGLLSGICNPETVGESMDYRESDLQIDPSRMQVVESAVGTWSFSAHDFDADELLYAALVMLQHALQMPELEKWRMSTDDLTTFLMACRKAYNDFVLYHNFRHIVDVLQAVFYFLLRNGILPPYPHGAPSTTNHPAHVSALLKPFDALTLLISAIGHDVGHPGVNNAFLVALNAPLAQLYNDRSVLEAFHCAAYSQILRRYWPEAFADAAMRKLMINSILATDMGLHFKYMVDMGNLQERLAASEDMIDSWTPKALEETRDLCCGLLIKCADISNVARKYDIAAQWAAILTDEFSNQGAMEKELNLPTCLFGGPPDRDDVIKMAESQIGFMNIFAGPLFEGMTNILPAMSFGVKEMGANRLVWERKIDLERSRRSANLRNVLGDGLLPSSSTPPAQASDEADLEHEVEGLPPLPVEREPSMSSSRMPRMVEDRPMSMSEANMRSPLDSMSPAGRRFRNASLGSSSPTKGHRKTSNSDSFHAPFPVPFAHQHSGSRRSSKDAALEQLEHLQLSSFSRLENPSFDGSRRGSADASLTTILVHSQTPQNKQEPISSARGSPVRRHPRSLSQPSQVGGCSSLPSSRSNATNNTIITTTAPQSPSTKASSLDEMDPHAKDDGQGSAATNSDTYLRPELCAAEQRQTLSAPDILAVPEMDHSKAAPMPYPRAGGSADGEGGTGHESHRNLRQSRSRSRLRGLRFWRKRWKSPGGVDVEHSE